jgi:hypothetical protein
MSGMERRSGLRTTARRRLRSLTDIDPFCPDQLGHAPGINAHCAVRRATSRHHHVEAFKQDIAIDWQGCGKTKWTNTADRVSSNRRCLFGGKHSGFATERRLNLLVVQTRVTAGDKHAAP